MIDVVFLLLIFFVCTASFQVPEVPLPTNIMSGTGSDTPTESEPILERITLAGKRVAGTTEWAINERKCESLDIVQEVLTALAEIDLSIPVTLDVGDDVPLGDMIDAYDLCRVLGFQRIQFAAEVE